MTHEHAVFTNHVMFDEKSSAEAYCRGTGQPESAVFRWGMGWAAPRRKNEKEEGRPT